MELDVSLYRGLVRVKPEEGAFLDDLIYSGLLHIYNAKEFEGREAPLVLDAYYAGFLWTSWRAGSYYGYGFWRDWLCRGANGVGDEEFRQREMNGPFAELINFSDCEGYLGAEVCGRLSQDFSRFKPDYMSWELYGGLDHTWLVDFHENYRRFADACLKAAKHRGCLRFH